MLENFGFSRNDAKVYQALLDLGVAKSGAVIRHAGVASSRVYASLNKLLAQGLVSTLIRNNIHYYKPEPPYQLMANTKAQLGGLEEIIEQAKNAAELASKKTAVAVYEGARGHRQAFIQHINMVEPGAELCIIEYGRAFRMERSVRELFSKNITAAIAAKRCKVKMIIATSLQDVMHKDLSRRLHIEFRLLPARYFSSMALDLSPVEAMLTVVGAHPVAICLRDPEIIEGFKKQFKLLWSIGKPVK